MTALYKIIEQLNRYAEALLKMCSCTLVPVEFNSKLTSTAAQVYYTNKECSHIELSLKLYKKYGLNRIKQALRHELAHVICIQKKGDSSHGVQFKKICTLLQGSMHYSVADAGSPCVTNEYLKEPYRYLYVCSVCSYYEYKRRKISNKSNKKCSCGEYVVNYTEIKL